MAIEENNRNTLTQLSKFKKVQSQISEDFTKQFSILEKLLDEFTTGKWKSPLIASVKILTFLLSKNKTFKKEDFDVADHTFLSARHKEVNRGGEKGFGHKLPRQQR